MTLLSTLRFLYTNAFLINLPLISERYSFVFFLCECWLQTEGSLLKDAQRSLCRMPVVFTRLKARTNLMGICLVKKLAESLELNSNEEAGGAKNSSHSDTENNDAEEDDTGDNSDEHYKE